MFKVSLSFIAVVAAVFLGVDAQAQELTHDQVTGKTPYQSPACSLQDYHEFDFMHGEWDLKVLRDGKWVPGGFSVNKPALGGCISFDVVSYINWGEFYRPISGRDGFAGFAISSYDKEARNWRQVWHDDLGAVVANLRGRRYPDGMRFVGQSPTKNSAELQRFEWKILSSLVREFTLDMSTDGGTEWSRIATVQMVRRVPR